MKAPLRNVSDHERALAAAAGLVLLVNGLRRRSALLLIGAACCFYRMYTANCKGYEMCGFSTRTPSANL